MTKIRKLAGAGALALTIALVAGACSSNSSSSSSGASGGGFEGDALTGAGATFPDPIYEQWFKDVEQAEPSAKINYQAIGSGGGVEQFTAKTVDFGASDAPLQADEIKALPSPYVELPTVLGGVVIAYNVSGLNTGLKLDGTTAAKIFLGDIKTWNDPAIAALNPDVSLPSTPISVVHRSDESGTTFVYTSWLSSQSKDWDTKVGADKAVQWPTGTGGDGNDGVAAAIGQTDGSSGYLSFDFAVSAKLGIADNKGAGAPARVRRSRLIDRGFRGTTLVVGLGLTALLALMLVELTTGAWRTFDALGLHFFVGTSWNPVSGREDFGALPFIFGSLVTSGVAIVIGVPIAVGLALLLNQVRGSIANPLTVFVDILAAIPSVVYGLWALFLLQPIFDSTVEPFLIATLGRVPLIGALFRGKAQGPDLFTAGVILAIMILPIVTAVSREA